MKENRKGLGMGLDLLLKASSHKNAGRDKSDIVLARAWFQEAWEREDHENALEAYYYYRRIVDLWPGEAFKNDAEKAKLLSQSLNNAAVILFEYGYADSARQYLERAVQIDSQNETAIENLKVMSEENNG